MNQTRRLAAILAADVVGFSRMMQTSEKQSVASLKALHADVIEPMVQVHEGMIMKRLGDGWLIEFPAIVKAVRCALDVQTAARERGDLHLRIGVHLGDVLFEEDDFYGDGVNVATRLQTASEPDAVLVSDIVHRGMDEELRGLFRRDGDRVLKNMPDPVSVYQWRADAEPPPRVGPALASGARMIAVLPFDNLSHESDQDFFADGITEEIITTLSKLSGLQVVARNSTFVYKGRSVDVTQVGRELGVDLVLEGSVRTAGNRVRITAQLIDAKTGMHLWADRFDRSLEDVFEVQDEIALRVATELQVEVLDGEMARFRGSGTRNLRAWAEQLLAVQHTRRITPDGCAEARRHAEKAISLDPTYSAPLCTLGFVCTIEARHRFSPSRAESVAAARDCANKALDLEPYNPEAYAILGFTHAIEGDLDTAIALFKEALKQNPNHADVAARLALTLGFNGQLDDAIRAAQQAIMLNPNYPGWYAGIYGFTLRLAGRDKEAEDAFRQYSEIVEGFGHLDLALVHADRGEMESARWEAKLVLKYRPDFSIGTWAETQLFADKSLLERDCAALRRLGLPE